MKQYICIILNFLFGGFKKITTDQEQYIASSIFIPIKSRIIAQPNYVIKVNQYLKKRPQVLVNSIFTLVGRRL